jgi:hypothetical protein
MNNTQKIKNTVAKIDLDKIATYLQEHPKSKNLKEIIKYSKRVLGDNEKEKVFKLGTDLAYDLNMLANSDYVKNEEEKKHWLEISRELFENTIGVKEKS